MNKITKDKKDQKKHLTEVDNLITIGSICIEFILPSNSRYVNFLFLFYLYVNIVHHYDAHLKTKLDLV